MLDKIRGCAQQFGISSDHKDIAFFGELVGQYESMANQFRPLKIETLFIAESPPYPRNQLLSYFYSPYKSSGDNALYGTLMDALYINQGVEKKDNLTKFKERGFYLIDAVKFPINEFPWKSYRDQLIEYFSGDLIKEIELLSPTNIILIKHNVCSCLFFKLKKAFQDELLGEFWSQIPFPFPGRNQKVFRCMIRERLGLSE